MTAKVFINQEHIYIPPKAKKRLRIGVFFLIVFSSFGTWLLAEQGVFKSGVQEVLVAKQNITKQKKEMAN